MKTRFLTPAVVAVLSLAAVSCSEKETETITYENNYEQALEKNDSLSVRISHTVEYYRTYEGGRSLRGKINNSIVEACFGKEYSGLTVEEASDALSDTLMANYQVDAGANYDECLAFAKENGDSFESVPATLCDWYYMMSGSFAGVFGKLQTYQVYSEHYQGGAHGMHYSVSHIIDLRTGRIVPESELFLSGYEAPVAALIRRSLEGEWGSDGIANDVFDVNEVIPNGNCGVSGDGVTWYYQPYEIASYAQGIIGTTVLWEELKPYLNPEYAVVD